MRTPALVPLALLTTACWTPGPGQLDPTRFPWDQPRPKPQAGYCIISLELPSPTGITARGGISSSEQAAFGAQPQLGCVPPSTDEAVPK